MARVLVVDDDGHVRSTLRTLLESDGHEVKVADDGVSATRILGQYCPDVLVTDLIMPDKEGLAMIIETRRCLPDTRIIAVSGGGLVASREYLRTAKALGADLALPKPIDPAGFLLAVKDLVRR